MTALDIDSYMPILNIQPDAAVPYPIWASHAARAQIAFIRMSKRQQRIQAILDAAPEKRRQIMVHNYDQKPEPEKHTLSECFDTLRTKVLALYRQIPQRLVIPFWAVVGLLFVVVVL